MRITLLAFLAVLTVGFLFPIQTIFPAKTEVIKRTVTRQEAYDSICQVASVALTNKGYFAKSTGSGIILPNGNVLTAAHCIDNNGNGKLDDNEKVIDIAILETDIWIKSDVIAMTNDPNIDLALVKPRFNILSKRVAGIQLAEYDVPLGDPVTIMGRRNSLPASITEGVANPYVDNGKLRMTSAASWFGGSGGAVYDKNHNLIGVLVSIGQGSLDSPLTVPIQREGKLTIIRTNFNYKVVITDMSFYVPLSHVKEFLSANDQLIKPDHKLKKIPNPNKEWFYYFIIWPSTGLLALLASLGLYRIYQGPRHR